MLGSACGGQVYTNPGPPDEPTTQPVDTTAPVDTAAPTGTGAPLAEIPKDEKGRVEKQADGTCLYIFPYPEGHCPPGASCNPGPPREPLAVKCPADAKGP